ncbi:Cytidylate kinase-like family protein [Oscillibacter sp. PC13]|nr:Cytidylate kinase-like family protein [Oscillibacter sp. PC13]
MQALAEKGPCIIMGRGANRILNFRDDVLNIFIYADASLRQKRIIEEYGVKEAQAEKILQETDRRRASYLRTYTGQVFGKAENYHLCIDSGVIGIENAVKLIAATYQTLL